ncbi:Na+/H+-translocating membrane pyrophosphatase [Clostridium tetanomorphum]|uniref:DUF3784 domain-containing protein n=1 Tax=Clostridium tetanomorphum TaxID=1553 RepID=A0A923E7H3_CLOTT|nr:hypothetical protein [Clostridium tetanomorphum]KAJ49485.1 hypothetical protein CTM_22816 [Clostridium tetanomorphum DSM 665]KAJ51438.1 hypothetical protein CTM_12640 [Clostridium tetanomorphum DSM 665]MBC2396531.1 hypothetical protein [Clostridium tetanomorphum]MBP1863857.1 Na+/H+-translocating membrane pyrophosphatase [Clostridium tetanomorphum]NRS84935.1 Na+/H+-translocating membrane pyrophosphatase [Clostridium tetanomorphum]
MFITKISLSYFFLIIGIIAIVFYVYFKFLIIKSSPNNKDNEKILGNMKDVSRWLDKNTKMSYISLFWAIVSIIAFIFLKFYYTAGLISIIFPFLYLALIVISIILFLPKNKITS